MYKYLNKLKKENEKLKKEATDKYFENNILETELDFINHLKVMKDNNLVVTNLISFVVFTSIFFGFKSSFDLTSINDIALLIGSSSASLLLGTKVATTINNKMLKDVELDSKTVDKKQKEITSKMDTNTKDIDMINMKLISNNDEIADMNYFIRNNMNDIYNEEFIKVESKPKKLVRKKIV